MKNFLWAPVGGGKMSDPQCLPRIDPHWMRCQRQYSTQTIKAYKI